MRTLIAASAAAAALLAGLGGSALAQQRGAGPPGEKPGGLAAPAPAATPAGQPIGSFSQSCRNSSVQGGVLRAECLDTQGRYRMSALPFAGCHSPVSNNNGVLYCEGATATAGAYVVQAPNNQNRGQNNNRNNNAGAFVAGAAAGALLGGNVEVYTPGYNYPTYGDQRYGDPRFDPRYGPQGWGYGHQAGEWVWIRDRADWVDRQIADDLRDGRLSRGDARDLRRQLDGLVDQENTYRRQGMAPWMRADLDKKFDQLAFRIHNAGRDGARRDPDRGPPPPPPPPYGYGR